jgi:hypothetical protein
MKKHVFSWLALILLVFIGCQKELSFENGNIPAEGSLQSDATGDCLPKTVNGAYVATTALVPATNTITVQVNVTKTGNYVVTTDTVNGYFFRSTGVFTSLGNTDVTLRGNGTPFTDGVDNFIVSFDSTICDIAVTVLPAGTGAAVYTLNGAPASCTGAVVSGTYGIGVALNATNTVALNVNVTTVGTYSITTTFQGMTFAASGAFSTTGANTVTLVGTGAPTTGGANTVPLTVGTTTCSFLVNVGTAAVGTLGGGPGACTPSTVGGVYTVGTPLTATNAVQVQLNVTTAGSFNISTNTVAGITFGGSGNATVGTQLITLVGTGTPTTAGAQTFTMTFGTSTCTFTVNVTGSTSTAAGSLGGSPTGCTPSTINGFYVASTALGAPNTVQIQANVTTAGPYSITTNTVTGFSFAATGNFATTGVQNVTLTGTGTPTTAGPQTFTVTWGNPTTSTCTFTVNVLPNDYFPRTTGSNWSYEQDNNVNDSIFRVVAPQTHTALGNTYNIFFSNDGTPPPPALDSSGYYRRSGGDYFEWFDAGRFIGYVPPAVWAEYTFLKDNVPLGTSWLSQGFAGTIAGPPPTALNIRFKYAIFQKDVAVSLTTSAGTVSYTNVIVVEEKFEREITPGVWQDITSAVGSFKSYYARGIGLIKFEAFDGSGASVFLQELRRFQIL